MTETGKHSKTIFQALNWNLGATVCVAAAGLGIQLLLASWNSAYLGVFNQLYAIFIISSQVAVFGIHRSVEQRYASLFLKPGQRPDILLSAMFAVVLISASVGALIASSSSLIMKMLDSKLVATGVLPVGLALIPFALNKTLMCWLNGLRKMRLFAIMTALRVIFLLIAISICVYIANPKLLGYCFLASETATLLVNLCVPGIFGKINFKRVKLNLKRHFSFGARCMWNGMVTELNTRVDVLMLGIFMTDSDVGIYSFALMFSDGIMSVYQACRSVVNPYFARAFKLNSSSDLSHVIRKSYKIGWAVGISAFACAFGAYFIIPNIIDKSVYVNYWYLMAMLCGTMALIGGFMVCNQMFIAANRPGSQFFVTIGCVIVNIIANATFIPMFGLAGAAIGTSIALLSSVVMMMLVFKRIFKNKFTSLPIPFNS